MSERDAGRWDDLQRLINRISDSVTELVRQTHVEGYRDGLAGAATVLRAWAVAYESESPDISAVMVLCAEQMSLLPHYVAAPTGGVTTVDPRP